MFTKHTLKLFVTLALVAIALSALSLVVTIQAAPAANEVRSTAPLDWYLASPHAVLDGDNNVISTESTSIENRWAPLDWYLASDHAVLDGDNNVLPGEIGPADFIWAPLDWYLASPHAVPYGDDYVHDQ